MRNLGSPHSDLLFIYTRTRKEIVKIWWLEKTRESVFCVFLVVVFPMPCRFEPDLPSLFVFENSWGLQMTL